jgi:WhiB family redox-sensing transcriptional regulator
MRNRTTKTTRAAAAHQSESQRPACAGVHPGTFYSYEGEPTAARNAREDVAKSICQVCPIQAACLDGALDRREPYGVWGGLTAAERNNVLFRRAIPTRG